MTRKIYKSAMGKSVDLGALLLQNEQVRAVGNMGVNAAGDLVDSSNTVIDRRNKQVQRQYARQTNVSAGPVSTSNLSARKGVAPSSQPLHEITDSRPDLDLDMTRNVEMEQKSLDESPNEIKGGLAAAIARSREVKQELEKTLRQRQQEQGVRKI